MGRPVDSNIETFVGEILAHAPTVRGAELNDRQKPEKSFQRLLRRDYVRDLRRNLNYRQLLELLHSAHRILPRLNREPLDVMPIEQQARLAANLGLHFQAAPRTGAEGMALRGFYVNKLQEVLKRPLIYVNTAHHPVAVSTTFCHELGHHLAADILRPRDQKVHLFLDVDYAEHMNDPGELAADVLVSLAGYPKPVAVKIFSQAWARGLVASTKTLSDAAFNEIHAHLKRVYGLNLSAGISPRQRLNYLSGMIHYAKLRWALLAEYDV